MRTIMRVKIVLQGWQRIYRENARVRMKMMTMMMVNKEVECGATRGN